MRYFSTVFLSIVASLTLKAQDVSNPSEFQYPDGTGLYYTIVDPDLKTVKTRPGSSAIVGDKLIVTYGNDVTEAGDIQLPSKVLYNDQEYTVIGIGEYGFHGVTSITIPETVVEIGTEAFAQNPLTSITIPPSVTSFGGYIFTYCTSLATVNLPENMTSIPPHTFAMCKALQTLDIPSTVTSIGEYAFYESGLTSIVLPEGLTEISEGMFYNCKYLPSIELPESIVTIGANAFVNCDNLTSLTLPANVASIGNNAFYYCDNLKEIISYNRTVPAISVNTFNAATYAGTLKVSKLALSSYKNHPYWQKFSQITAIPVPATDITLDRNSISLYATGPSTVLRATVTPDDSSDEITWSISPEGFATVSSTGLVLGKKTGEATVTVSAGSVSAQCAVVILDLPATAVVINPLAGELKVGDTAKLTAQVYPSASTAPVTWASSNPDVIEINPQSGELTALSVGGAVITATSGKVSGKMNLTVNPIEATSITLNVNSVTLTVGENADLTAVVSPDNTTDPTVTWLSSDNSVAVWANGSVYGVAPGSATITAICGSVSAVCNVTVNAIPADAVTLSTDEINPLYVGQTYQLLAVVSPDNATDKTVTWTSSNNEVATVTIDGLVTALKAGTTQITATCGDVSANCDVTVKNVPASEIVLNVSEASLKVGQTQQLYAISNGELSEEMEWESDDTTVATVSDNGLVTAVSVGEATITVSSGSLSTTCKITVTATEAEQILLSESTVTVNVGNSITITATVLPETTTFPNVFWASLNEEIASVEDGKIMGLSPGTTQIAATCGNVTSFCSVTVLNPATSIVLNETSLTLEIGDMDDLIATVTPENTTDVLVWESSNPDVAVVNDHGIVTALSEGTATITATCGSVSASCTVTVTAEDNKDDDTNGITEVKADNEGHYNVYNLSGIRILVTKDFDAVKALPAGIYIVNGKKVYNHR